MRLSTLPDRDEAAAIEVIRAAVRGGVDLLDTSDAYAHHDGERGHSERLIQTALAGLDHPHPTLVTKGGLRRPKGRWVPDGRAKWLREACEASRAALGVERIDLYLLHAPDPKTKLTTSARALARLRDDGLVHEIGLCNVSVTELESVSALGPWAAVQVEFGIWNPRAARGGVIEYAARHGLRLLAHRPLGGAKGAARIAKHETLREVAKALGVTPHQVALAYLRDLATHIVPLPGPTTVEHAAALGEPICFDAADRRRLDAAFEVHAHLRTPRASRRPPAPKADEEVVLVMGLPTSGKTTYAKDLEAQGYLRFNRDEAGGTLAKLHRALDAALAAGARRAVLDNTYVERALRDEVLEVAWRHGLEVRCFFAEVDLDVAMVRGARRALERTGGRLDPEALAEAQARDPNVIGPDVILRYARALEPPAEDEGFSRIEVRPSGLEWPSEGAASGVLVALDGVLRSCARGRRAPLTPDDVVIDEARARQLRAADGRIGALVWAPEVETGAQTEAELTAVLDRTREALDLEIDFEICRHAPGPQRCWCRLPLPGLGVRFLLRHRVDPARATLIGRSAADKTFARRLGVPFVAPEDFFD